MTRSCLSRATDSGTFIMTDISPAVLRTDDGAVLTIEVSAGSKRAVFPSGYNEWRRAVGCSVQAPAQEGKANREVIAIIAETLGTPRNKVRILSGETSSLKRVLVEGEDRGELVRRLNRALDRE